MHWQSCLRGAWDWLPATVLQHRMLRPCDARPVLAADGCGLRCRMILHADLSAILQANKPYFCDVCVNAQAEAAAVRHPTLTEYLQYVQLRRLVTFKRLQEPKVRRCSAR